MKFLIGKKYKTSVGDIIEIKDVDVIKKSVYIEIKKYKTKLLTMSDTRYKNLDDIILSIKSEDYHLYLQIKKNCSEYFI